MTEGYAPYEPRASRIDLPDRIRSTWSRVFPKGDIKNVHEERGTFEARVDQSCAEYQVYDIESAYKLLRLCGDRSGYEVLQGGGTVHELLEARGAVVSE